MKFLADDEFVTYGICRNCEAIKKHKNNRIMVHNKKELTYSS